MGRKTVDITLASCRSLHTAYQMRGIASCVADPCKGSMDL